MNTFTGLVTKSTGSNYLVERLSDAEIISCKIRGKIRLDGLRTTNPVSVGDRVEVDLDESYNSGVITKIYPRTNCVIRRATNLSKESHILASNLDQCLIVATLIMPETPLEFIDRMTVSAVFHNVEPVIVFNKADLYKDCLDDVLLDTVEIYRKVGFTALAVSSVTGEGIEQLREILKDKITLLSGNSGTGKSTLINTINPGLNLRTGDVSMSTLSGKHTTTFAEMFKLNFGGRIVDTPGIRGYGIVNMSSEDVGHNFPEIFSHLQFCKFNNCTHTHEPGCAVKAAVEQGEISESRYHSYLSIISDDNNKYRTNSR